MREKRPRDYVEHFKHVLEQSVSDRLRTSQVSVFMSGGLDSPAVAATAKALLSKDLPSFSIRAYTAVYDRLLPDQERRYSRLAAEALGIPHRYLVTDDYRRYESWDEP